MIIAETPRLSIREFTPGDATFIFQLLNTPSWLQYIGDRKIKTLKDALKYLENGPIRSYKDFGFGLYLVSLKEEEIPIGMCGLIKRELLDDVDMGFAFLPAYEGKGFGFESSTAVMNYAKYLSLKRLVAITLPVNEKSINLLVRLGMKYEKMVQFPNDEKELMLFSINF